MKSFISLTVALFMLLCFTAVTMAGPSDTYVLYPISACGNKEL